MEDRRREFLAFYERYKQKIYNYFWYRTNFNRELAEDLTSEVFLKALRKFEDFNPRLSFQAWIYTIAHNHLVDYYKLQKKNVSLDEAFDLAGSGRQEIEDKVFLQEVLAQITKLPDYYKEVIILKYINGLSTREIAEIMGKDEGAIRVALHRAVKVLKEKTE